MFQVVFDNRQGIKDLGNSILQFFMLREQQIARKEDLKLQQGQFKLLQEQVELKQKAQAFEQNRQLQTALGTALGLGAGQTEQANQGAGNVFGALAGLPSNPLTGGLQALGQAGQQAVAAQPTPEQAISQQTDPFAQAAAATSLAGERDRAATRGLAERTFAQTTRIFKSDKAFRDAKFEFDKGIKERTLALQEADSARAKKVAQVQLGKFALESARVLNKEFLTTVQALVLDPTDKESVAEATRDASKIVFGTSSPLTIPQHAARITQMITELDDPKAVSKILAPLAPIVVLEDLGVSKPIRDFYADQQLEGDATDTDIDATDQEILDEIFSQIDRSRNTFAWKQGEKRRVLRGLRAITGNLLLTGAIPQERDTLTEREAIGGGLRNLGAFIRTGIDPRRIPLGQ